MKLDILVIAAHPDDAELSCGGTIAKETARGKKVGILDLTQGELGTRGSVKIRYEEAAAAAKILNLSYRHNLKMADGFFKNDEENQLKIVEVLRATRPDIVLCNAIDDRHPDHAKGSQLASVSCFLSGLRRIETKVDGTTQKAWRPKQVYHYIQWKDLEPDIVVDISGYIDVKIKSLKAFQSQFFNTESDEPATPISSTNFEKSIEYRAANLGRLISTDHAEGFTVERFPAVDSIFDLI